MVVEDAPEDFGLWAASRDGRRLYLDATAVAQDQQAVVILGAPGAGKSSLALALMAGGARLIADDGLWVSARDGRLWADRPEQAVDMIEARGIGLLKAGPVTTAAAIALVVDLDRVEPHRLPPARSIGLDRQTAPLIFGKSLPHLSLAIGHALRFGRAEPR